jgi:tetratricopeptide (TPR) repeat protein
MKHFLLLMGVLMNTLCMAQPAWVNKAKKSVFSIVTYDQENKIKNTGNGFFIDEEGTGVSDYTLFKGAQRAVIMDADGKQYPIVTILGANDTYDVVKFQVQTDKKNAALTEAKSTPAKGATLYLLPYATQKQGTLQSGTVEEVSEISGSHYYTLNMSTTDKMVSCPVTNANGEVVGLLQAGGSEADKKSYVIGVSYVKGLAINAFSGKDYALKSIGIRKGLPAEEDQALIYLYMNSSTQTPEEYLESLNYFLSKFPRSYEGYLRRASFYIDNYKDNEHYVLAEADIQQAQNVADKKENALYSISKIYQAVASSDFTYKDWNNEKALATIQQAIALNPMPVYIQLEGDLYYSLQQYDKAFESYDKVNRSEMASEMSLYSAAKAKEMMGDHEEAMALMDSTINRFSRPLTVKAAPYLYQRALMRADQKKYREAIADFNEYQKLVGSKATALFYFQREQVEMECRMYQQALEDMEKAVELEPTAPLYLVELTSLYVRFNRLDDAITLAKKGIEVAPENADLYRMLGYCQLQKKQKEEGKKNLLKAKELGDTHVDAILQKYAK